MRVEPRNSCHGKTAGKYKFPYLDTWIMSVKLNVFRFLDIPIHHSNNTIDYTEPWNHKHSSGHLRGSRQRGWLNLMLSPTTEARAIISLSKQKRKRKRREHQFIFFPPTGTGGGLQQYEGRISGEVQHMISLRLRINPDYFPWKR